MRRTGRLSRTWMSFAPNNPRRRPRLPTAALLWMSSRAQPLVINVPHEAHRETRVDLYTNAGGEERLVTTVEILSLANKTPGAKGRDLYLRKQQEILESSTHLVEIDLLRGGQHT